MDPNRGISVDAWLFAVLLILALPIPWAFSIALAAAVHELCHLLAIMCCKQQSVRFSANALSAQLVFDDLTALQELLCALAGPLGGAMLVFAADRFPRLAVCAAVQSAYNMIPIYPLDGGRILRCLLTMLCSPPVAAQWAHWIQTIVCALALFVALYLSFGLRLGPLPVGIVIFHFLRTKSAKMPCKLLLKRVQ